MLKYEEIQQIHLELSSHCNSSCPQCPRNIDGGVVSPLLKPNSLSLADIKHILPPEFLGRIDIMNICGNYGDPIMCKDVLDIVKYFSSVNKELELAMHTNGGVRDEDFWSELGSVIAGMTRAKIIFSIDGLEDTNHLYRIGVDWNRLMKNVKAFISAGGKAEWDFLIFKHNQHQVDTARQMSVDMGFVKFTEGSPHGFNYNGKIRVVDRHGKFLMHLEPSDRFSNEYGVMYQTTDFDIDNEYVVKFYSDIKGKATDPTHYLYEFQKQRFIAMDNVMVHDCMSVRHKEIYIDSDGGIHPCCYLGHVNQESLPIAELAYHRKWIEDRIGLENINALKHTVKDIVESYFPMIEESWSKTFLEGGNPMCVFKCGIQRPSGQIRIV